MNTNKLRCACGSNKKYVDCCARYLDEGEVASNAEVLMRSRYTAYTLDREDFLLATWYHSTRPISLQLADGPYRKWLNLEVKHHEQFSPEHAVVEFIARYKISGRAHRLHEISRFVYQAGRWFYVDGDIL